MRRGGAGLLAALVVAVATALAACGGGDGDGSIAPVDFAFAETDTLAAPEIVAAAGDAAWFAVGGRVVAVDAATRQVREPVEMTGVEGMAAAEDAVWVVRDDATVRRIDLVGSVGEPVRIAPQPELSIDSPATGPMAVGESSVVVALRERLVRIDRATGEVLGSIPVAGVSDLVADSGVVWAAASGRLLRIDERTGEVTGEARLGREGGDVAARDGRVWLRSGDVLREIDPATMTPFPEPVPLGDEPPGGLEAGDGVLWGVVRERDEVVGIDPGTGAVTARLTLDSPYSSQRAELSSVEHGAGATWVGTQIGNRAGVIDTR